MSTIDENDSIATELGPSEDSATPMLTGELAAGGGAATVVSVPVPELVSSERFSSTGELAAGGGAATVVSVPVPELVSSERFSSTGEFVEGAGTVDAASFEDRF